MAKITGIGGVFLNSSGDTKKLLKWYDEVLDLNVTEFGVNFLHPNTLTLLTFNSHDNGEAILNFTVDNLDFFLEKLKSRGVKLIKDISVLEYGKFAQIEDVLGNIIELWEPFEIEYKKMVEEEITEYKKRK